MHHAQHYEWLLPYFWSLRNGPEWPRLRPAERWSQLAGRALAANGSRQLDLQTIERFSAEQEALDTLERLWRAGQPYPRAIERGA